MNNNVKTWMPLFILLFAMPLTAAVSRAKKPVAHKKGVAAKPAKPAVRWTAYENGQMRITMRVPAAWEKREGDQAVGFSNPVAEASRAAVGIMKSRQSDVPIEEAVRQHYENEGRPAQWKQTNTRVADCRAIKVVSVNKEHPDHRVVYYYVEGPLGAYLISCFAPQKQWSTYSPLFTSILKQLRFI